MSKKRKNAKNPVIDIKIADVRQMLERIKAQISEEDHRLLASLVQTLLLVFSLLQEKRRVLARLRRLFGISSTEKTSSIFGQQQGQGTGDTGSEKASGQEDGGGQSTPPEDGDAREPKPPPEKRKKKKKGHGRKPASEYDAEHIHVPHESLHVGDRCPRCERGNLGRQSDSSWLRIFGGPCLFAMCWDLERLRCNTCGEVYTAQAPEQAQGPKYSESAVSMIALLSYGMGMPWYRLGLLQGYLNIPVPPSTQWEVVEQRYGMVKPAYRELCRLGANGSVQHSDDTYMRILELMGKRRARLLAQGELTDPHRTGLFTTAIVSVTAAGPIALFFTGRKHAGENLADLLDVREPGLGLPILMCDGLDRNVPKGHDVIEANCNCHGRRHVVDEVENFPRECRHVLEQLGKVFKNEDTCKQKGLTGVERMYYHQQHSGPVIAELKKWIEAQLNDKLIEPNSGLGESFQYLLKRWDKLMLFLRQPDAPLENNKCERVLKMAIRHRNNSKFYRSARGAQVGDCYMTLIHTAVLHNENPFEYLTALMVHDKLVAENPADWLPWTFRATLERLGGHVAEAA